MTITIQIDPIEELINEHKEVLGELALLEQNLRHLEKKTEFEDSDKEALSSWLDNFEKHINLHIDKEDNVLFKALEKYMPSAGGPLQVMEIEHRSVENHIEQFQKGIRQGIELKPGTLNQFCEVGFSMIDLLQAHLGKEEYILFPMANNILTAEDKQTIAARYKEMNSLFGK